MSNKYTLIYFKRTGCGHCKKFDSTDIFPQLKTKIDQEKHPIDTAIIDFNPDSKNEALLKINNENLEKYGDEYNLFIKKFKGVPSLVLFFKIGYSIMPTSPDPVVKYFPIRYYEKKNYLSSTKILEDIKKKIAIIEVNGLKKKYIKYKYKYLELKNKYLQQK
jgi:hypothetical protein